MVISLILFRCAKHSFFFRILHTIQHKILFQRLSVFNNKLVISVRKRRRFSRRLWFLIKELFCHKKIFLVWSFYLDEIHSLLDNPLILPQAKILISFWSQKAENQKFEIEEKVMSERVKMPNRHFLRSDYLHFFFYLKFLVFVSLVFQISIFQ